MKNPIPLSKASPEIVAALLRMLDKLPGLRPFVVIADAHVAADVGFFVQFCTAPPDTHNKRGIIFDVPALKITYGAFESAVGSRNINEVVDGGAAMAVALLRDRGVTGVRIVESDTVVEPVGGQS